MGRGPAQVLLLEESSGDDEYFITSSSLQRNFPGANFFSVVRHGEDLDENSEEAKELLPLVDIKRGSVAEGDGSRESRPRLEQEEEGVVVHLSVERVERDERHLDSMLASSTHAAPCGVYNALGSES